MTQLNPESTNSILIIDDNIICLKIYEAYFANSGLNIRLFNKPQEALEIIQKEKIAGVITDMIMPETSGLNILKAVNKHQKNCFKYLVTGNTDLNSIIWAVNEIGVDRILFKPLDMKEEDLIYRIYTWINGQKQLTTDLTSDIRRAK